ncbi:MAG: peptidoglycan DD-metalloendopeptidase family protein [Patescibacteria group bacterium]
MPKTQTQLLQTRALSFIVLMIVAASIVTTQVSVALAAPQATISSTEDDIAAKKQELDSANQKVKELRDQLSHKQNDIKSLSDQMAVIDSRVELIQLQIKATQLDIDKNAAEIDRTEKLIEEKQNEIDTQKTIMNDVIQKLYMEKDVNILSIVVEAKNFSELIEKTEYLSRIRSQLKDTVDKLSILKGELTDQKSKLEEKMKTLEQLKADKVAEEGGLEDQKYAKAKILEQTRGEEGAFKSQLSKAQAEEQAVNAQIIRLVQEQARRKRSEGVEGRPGRDQVVNTGGFVFPLDGVNQVGITGGDFMDPSYGMGFPHTGVDLRASQGTPLHAAGSGVVVAAYDSGGPGLSYIAIDHGNGLITKYLHVSAIYVTAGDVVNAGDVIGLTGGQPGGHGSGIFTTGAHLHFEVNDYQGHALNPHNYLAILPPMF